jgi:type IV pilus assembly protein PilV
MTTVRAAGFTLLEILITLIILAIGMLGLANLQSKIHVTEIESYQRAHAVLLLQDMIDRMNSNRNPAGLAAYDTGGAVLGLDEDGNPVDAADCTLPADPNKSAKVLACNDRNQWSAALQGASEQRAGNSSGGMIGARGCIEQLQAPDATPGVCTPGRYRVTVAWQGLHKTMQPSLQCATGMFGPDDALRRAIATEFTVGVPRC